MYGPALSDVAVFSFLFLTLGCHVAPTPLAASDRHAASFTAYSSLLQRSLDVDVGIAWESYAQHVLLLVASDLSALACTCASLSFEKSSVFFWGSDGVEVVLVAWLLCNDL